MWWGYWLSPFGFFRALLVLLLIFGVVRLILFRRYGPPWGGWGPGPWRHGWHDHAALDPAALLKRRLASGEITEAEYQRLGEILNR